MSEKKINAAITGVGGYVPDKILDNAELEKMVDTSDEWIRTRTGIKERRILDIPGKGTSYLGTKAVQNLIEKTKLNPEEIDLIICTTVTGDYLFPATANIIGHDVGAKNAFSFDLGAACSGFLYGIRTAASFIEAGTYNKVIVVGADKMSAIVDYTNRNTCIIFGDGAGAVLMEPNQEGYGIQDSVLYTDGIGKEYLLQPAGGSVKPPSTESIANKEHFIYQDGKTVFKFAVTKMAEASAEIMERNKLKSEDVAYLLAHQANKRIIDATRERMGIDENKVLMNIQRYGNTTSGTIPLLMWDFEKKLKKDDNLILSAFGGGFTWGSIFVKWLYNG
ncbi:MAG: beta-ketoacyl-ACP synthase III [Bacteroidota bacterium]|nr:beta-ketoacyl-ACP synthase III [Bacteroidota bacterium]